VQKMFDLELRGDRLIFGPMTVHKFGPIKA
jgi:hypothetical protein